MSQKIKFNNNPEIFNVDLSPYHKNRIKCIFHPPFDSNTITYFRSGFKEINEHNLKVQSDFSNMKYIYHQPDEKTFIFTSDKDDIYVRSRESDITKAEQSTKPHVPSLEEVRQVKLSELSFTCRSSIINGINIILNDQTEHFSYSSEDQLNIKELYEISISTNSPVYYHADDKEYRLYSVGEITEIYKMTLMNKMHHLTYYNQLRAYINNLDNVDSINNILYGVDLTGAYLEAYNNAIKDFKEKLESLTKQNVSK